MLSKKQSLVLNKQSFLSFHQLQSLLGVVAVVAITLFNFGCTARHTTLEMLGGEELGIFSNRPISHDQFIAVIKLKSPALLAHIPTLNQQNIDPELLKTIEQEQTASIDQLKQISSEIRVLFRYRMVLNGLAIVAPISVKDKIKQLMNVAYVENEGSFARPKPMLQPMDEAGDAVASVWADKNSVKFIGAEAVHQLGITGKGMKVGIIDTGIDYTHSMLGGQGTEQAYKDINPALSTSAFPNAKVVAGIDLAGTDYDSASGVSSKHIPLPDENPLDEGGHGSHVAGTVAGIGDGVETYSGVAPDAILYAIKVFGAEGSTGDAVVIAGLEYAADPNRDGLLDDQLDVVNMSLGSSYGNPHVLYSEAIQNLVHGGTVVVASAGNSGNFDYIVGAPSIVDEAFSVAASIDDAYHNWQFQAVSFSTPTLGDLTAEAIEGSVSKPISEAGPVVGKLVAVGALTADLTPEQAALLNGNVALVDRGVVTFAEKVTRAVAAGAIGVVVANNQDGEPFSMGGDKAGDVPAIMITKDLGVKIKDEMSKGDVVIHFQTTLKINKPELIDTLTDFSSRGPRSFDGLLKPEISAPGANVMSAAMGKGNKGVKMSGTSMAGPHMAGVMALLKQAHPYLLPSELKSLVMGHALEIKDAKQAVYPLSRQGAGRVQTLEAVQGVLVSKTAAISLGEVSVDKQKMMMSSLSLRNIGKEPLTLKVSFSSNTGLSLAPVADLTLSVGEEKSLSFKWTLNSKVLADDSNEMDGRLFFSANEKVLHQIPVLAMVQRLSQIKSSPLKVFADSQASAAGSISEIILKNNGFNVGDVLPFNLLGFDSRKINTSRDPNLNRGCDLQAVGYRVIDKPDVGGETSTKILQFAFKLFEPMTTWNVCEVSVLIDADGDKNPEQELAGVVLENLKGISTPANAHQFASVLLDAKKTRELRADFEEKSKTEGKKAKEDYSKAVIDQRQLTYFNNSTVTILEVDISQLSLKAEGDLSVKVATVFNEPSSIEVDDYLGKDLRQWKKISVNEKAQAFMGLPESITIEAGKNQVVDFTAGEGKGSLMLLYPNNRGISTETGHDDQLQILSPLFGL